MLSISDFTFYRYLGEDKMISNGVRMQPREVVGLMQVNEDLFYIAHPIYPRSVAISGDSAKMIIATSRKFTAQPDALFKPDFNFTPIEEEKKGAPKPAPVKKPTAPATPLEKAKADQKEQRGPGDVRNAEVEEGDITAARTKIERERMITAFGDMQPLQYAPAIYSGGSANNYAVKPVKKCGKIHLEVKGLDELSVPGTKLDLNGVSPPDYVLEDIQNNVMPGVGLNMPLPFKRLYVGLSKAGDDVGSHIATYRVHGFYYGAITLDAKQIIRLLGGFNSLSVAHVITHELAHFVDHTMIRNVDKMKFEQAIRGKKIHPDSLRSGAISSVPAEHFATLAELMVWGNCLRNVYTLNGIEILEKYFENRYIPQSDIESRKI